MDFYHGKDLYLWVNYPTVSTSFIYLLLTY